MLTKRIIPCLDVKDGMVVKGVRFREHRIMGDVVEFAQRYCEAGADELVFYDITASSENRTVDVEWVERIVKILNIPFCVSGGIRNVTSAQKILAAGADKISINSPALENPQLISELAHKFGSQCVVVGIDSFEEEGDYFVYQYTGDVNKTRATFKRTLDWAMEVQNLGAGEIVLNCMNKDGVRQGYDVQQLKLINEKISIPLIASGGAGDKQHFVDVFEQAKVDGALAATVFHEQKIIISELKDYLSQRQVTVRL